MLLTVGHGGTDVILPSVAENSLHLRVIALLRDAANQLCRPIKDEGSPFRYRGSTGTASAVTQNNVSRTTRFC
jgi:hypothetical protein